LRHQILVAAASGVLSPGIVYAQAAAPAAPEPVEVTVTGNASSGKRRQQSAEAVNVVELRRAKQQSADLGEVLARTQGVAVRRDGGLGSEARFSLNGLYDQQVRFFFDGVPLELAGYPFGVANVPLNLVDRVEVYRGVVPTRFGADALGGAVNLVSDDGYWPTAGASYQVGSFGTHRTSVNARHYHEPSGALVRGSAFLDSTNNNYEIDVRVADAEGQLSPATVRRFHDDYRAYGASLEVGVVERPWAKRLLLRGFAASFDKELQHNTIMSSPYGEVRYGQGVRGATLRYEVSLAPSVELELVGSYARLRMDYVDRSRWSYDWHGKRVFERPMGGEVDTRPHDQTLWHDGFFARALLGWQPTKAQALRASVTPQLASRRGADHLRAASKARDPLSAERELLSLVSGLEYELNLFEARLSNVIFVKDYYYAASSEELLPGNVFHERQASDHAQGAGNTLRYRFAPWLYAKASYEYATRLPSSGELFGDGALVLENLGLVPEVSHNANLGPRLELKRQPFGDLTLDINGFWRNSDRLIVLLGTDQFYTYENLYAARALGLESAASWTSPGRLVTLDGSLTWLDLRNASTAGAFSKFEGDRIPNRPYLFGSWGARLRFDGVLDARDSVEPFYHGRFVREFFRGWESVGASREKQTVDTMLTHTLGASWTVARDAVRATSTFEIDNVTDAKVFDNFGVQRPGRAFYLKASAELR
jgi:vitamin B12 transporter